MPRDTAVPAAREKRLRADARRNYERLTAAATEMFAEHGADAPLDDIAKRAGVGSATLYRHFPSRLDLLEAVLRERAEALCARGRELLAEPSPGAALEAWLLAVIEHSSTYRGVAAAQAVLLDHGPESSTARHAEITEVGEALLLRAQAAGDVTSDIEISELLKLINAIAWMSEQTSAPMGQARRMLKLVMLGILSRR